MRAKVAELEEADPRDELPRLSPDVERRLHEWVMRAYDELPFADALHLLGRSSDHFRDSCELYRVKDHALEKFSPNDAQLFIDALDLAQYFTNVARWVAEPNGERNAQVIEAARDRVKNARRAVRNGEAVEVAFRRRVFEKLEVMYETVRDTREHFRPLWLDSPEMITQQLTLHAGFIASSLKDEFPALAAKLVERDAQHALFQWVGFDGLVIAPSVSLREKGRIAAKLLGVVYGRTLSAGQMRNELASIRETSVLLTEFGPRVPPTSNGER